MTQLDRSAREAPSFVPPEPSAQPPRYDPKFVPRWIQIAMVICVILVGAIAVWLSVR